MNLKNHENLRVYREMCFQLKKKEKNDFIDPSFITSITT